MTTWKISTRLHPWSRHYIPFTMKLRGWISFLKSFFNFLIGLSFNVLITEKRHFVMDQSIEEEVLVWVFPNHESKTSDLEKPILALPIHRIDIPEKLKKWHQEVEKVASGG